MNKDKAYIRNSIILVGIVMAILFLKNAYKKDHIFSVETDLIHRYISDMSADVDEYVDVKRNGDGTRLDQPEGILLKWPWKEWAEYYRIHITSQTAETDFHLDCQEQQIGVYNLIPGIEYSYKIYGVTKENKLRLVAAGKINPSGRLRMIKIDSIYNVRDLGGWETESGKRVRYGRVFRGSEMNGFHNIVIDEAGMNLATDLLGITVDLDLRTEEESQGITSSPLGSEVEYIRIPVNSYADYDGSQSLEQIVDLLLDQETMYIHCWGGCDRTGTICWLLLGVLGVPEEELIKDYELSSFSIFGVRDSNSKEYLELKNKIDSYTGKTLQNKIENYFIECGVSAKKIEQLRATLLEERTTMD